MLTPYNSGPTIYTDLSDFPQVEPPDPNQEYPKYLYAADGGSAYLMVNDPEEEAAAIASGSYSLTPVEAPPPPTGAELRAYVEELQAQVAQLTTDNATLQAEKVQLEAEKVALEAEKTALTTQVADLEAEITTLTAANTQLESDAADLNAYITELEAAYVALGGTLPLAPAGTATSAKKKSAKK